MRFLLQILLFLTLPNLYAKSLLVGIPPLIPPFVILDSQTNLSGFDVDIMNEICRRIEMQCQYEPSNWDGVFKGIQNSSLDVGIGDITITPDLQAQYIFSLPYLQSYAQFVAQKKSSIVTRDDIRGKTVGVHHIGLFGPVIFRQFGSGVTIKTYEYINDMILGLTLNDVDVIILDALIAEYLTDNNNNLSLVGGRIALGFGYGIVSAKSREDLIFQINKALLSMETDGTYLSIYNTYFFGSN